MDKKLKQLFKTPVSIRERAYEVIRDEILDGRILPGSRMVETQLAKLMGISRTPVREALHMLEMEGLLEAIPRVGYRVKGIGWNEVVEICEIRAVNETLAALWAMERITPGELQALDDNLAVSESMVKKGDSKSFIDCDAEFHEILVRSSGSRRLLELCKLLRRHMLRYRIESVGLPKAASLAIGDHRRILDCVKRKDKEGVESAIRAHLEQAKEDVLHYGLRDSRERKPER